VLTAILAVFGGVLAFSATSGGDVYACDPSIEQCDDEPCDPSVEQCDEPCDPSIEQCDVPCDQSIEQCDTPPATVTADNCYDAMGSSSWLICSAGETMSKANDSLMELIGSFMEVKPLLTDKTSAIFVIWGVIKDFGNIIFVILFLVMIYAQLTGKILDAYNIRKMLPRVIVVAILMNLSYYICAIGVDLANIIGSQLFGVFEGARQTAESAIIASGGVANSYDWTSVAQLVVGGAGAVTGAVAVLAVFSPGGLVYMLIIFLVGAIIALLAAYLTLVARQAIIIVLVAVSPIAFVAYLLPNTEKLFGKWSKMLMQMLLLYPIFAALYGGATLAGWAIMVAAHDAVGAIMGLAVQAIPLIMTPFLIKSTGTILDKVGQFVRAPFNPLQGFVRGWAGEKQQISKQKMLANAKPYTPHARLASWLDRNKAMRQEHIRQTGNDVASRNALYVQGEQQKVKSAYEMVQVAQKDANGNVMTNSRGDTIFQWQKMKVTRWDKEGKRYNASEILKHEAETDRLRLSEKMRSGGHSFLAGQYTDRFGNLQKIDLTSGKDVKNVMGIGGVLSAHDFNQQWKSQKGKGEMIKAENDLLASKWNNDRQDTEDTYYDMWELVNSRASGKRHEEWMRRSAVFAGVRGERGAEFALAVANAQKAKIDKEAGELGAKILGKTVKSTKDAKEWLMGYQLNDDKDMILDAAGLPKKASEWLERRDENGNVKFRINIQDKPLLAQVLAEYVKVGDPDLIDIVTQTGRGGNLSHAKVDVANSLIDYKVKEHVAGVSSLLATNAGNSLIGNFGELDVNMMFSASKTEKASNFVSGDAMGVQIWKKIMGFYNPANNIDAYRYTINEADIRNFAEPNGQHVFVDDATGGIKTAKYNKMVVKNLFDIASSFHLANTTKQTQEKIKSETRSELLSFYEDLKGEFDRVLDGYDYDTKTGKLKDRLTGKDVAIEDLQTLRRKRDTSGNEAKFLREL
jgi:hypothetical protein